jgi:hypothetical protein
MRSNKQWSGPGSGRSGIILAHQDPYPFQPNVKLHVLHFFPDNFSKLSKILKIL